MFIIIILATVNWVCHIVASKIDTTNLWGLCRTGRFSPKLKLHTFGPGWFLKAVGCAESLFKDRVQGTQTFTSHFSNLYFWNRWKNLYHIYSCSQRHTTFCELAAYAHTLTPKGKFDKRANWLCRLLYSINGSHITYSRGVQLHASRTCALYVLDASLI